MPGVLAVVTADDLGIADSAWPARRSQRACGGRSWPPTGSASSANRSWPSSPRPGQGEDAADLVVVDYEPLPRGRSTAASAREVLFPEVGTNVVAVRHLDDGPTSPLDVVVEERIINQRVTPAPIEPRSAAAHWTTIASSTTRPARAPIRPASLRRPTASTGRGPRGRAPTSAAASAPSPAPPRGAGARRLSRRVGRPVRWTETRTENMVAMPHGRAQVQHGHASAAPATAASPPTSWTCCRTPAPTPRSARCCPCMTRMMRTGVYDIPNVGFIGGVGRHQHDADRSRTAAPDGPRRPPPSSGPSTCSPPRSAWTRPRCAAATCVRPTVPVHHADRHRPTTSATTPAALDRALDAAGYAELRAEQAAAPGRGDPCTSASASPCYVEITAGGGARVRHGRAPTGRHASRSCTGSTPYGQGHHTTWAMLVADRLGVADGPRSRSSTATPTSSRRGRHRRLALGAARRRRRRRRRRQAGRRRPASGRPTCSRPPSTTSCSTATRGASTWPAPRPSVWAGSELADRGADAAWSGVSDFTQPSATFPFGAHVAVVEVDTETGRSTCAARRRRRRRRASSTRCWPRARCTAASPRAWPRRCSRRSATTRTATRSRRTSPTTRSSRPPSCPCSSAVAMETPTPLNALGAKGIGESGTIGSTPAVQNAVVDALAHLGVRHIDMPFTPERVWRRAATSGRAPSTAGHGRRLLARPYRRAGVGVVDGAPGRRWSWSSRRRSWCSRRRAPSRWVGSNSTRTATAGWPSPGWLSGTG